MRFARRCRAKACSRPNRSALRATFTNSLLRLPSPTVRLLPSRARRLAGETRFPTAADALLHHFCTTDLAMTLRWRADPKTTRAHITAVALSQHPAPLPHTPTPPPSLLPPARRGGAQIPPRAAFFPEALRAALSLSVAVAAQALLDGGLSGRFALCMALRTVGVVLGHPGMIIGMRDGKVVDPLGVGVRARSTQPGKVDTQYRLKQPAASRGECLSGDSPCTPSLLPRRRWRPVRAPCGRCATGWWPRGSDW